MLDTYLLTVDNQIYEFTGEQTYQDLAKQFQDREEFPIVLVQVDERLKELNKAVDQNGHVKFITTADPIGKSTYRRSVIFLMNAALYKLFPERNINIMHSIGQGVYCEIDGDIHIDETFLSSLKEKMLAMVEANLPIQKRQMNRTDAMLFAHDRHYYEKEKILRYRRNSMANYYWIGNYANYFYGAMCPSTGGLGVFDLLPYQEGFMLMFPDANPNKVEEFKPLDKLFGALHGGADWGAKLGIPTIGALNDVISSGQILNTILVQEAMMEKELAKIAEMICSQPDKKFVMIAGPSSSGKTTFSHRLSIQLIAQGKTPHPIALDDFYVNREDTPLDEFGEMDYECLEAIDLSLFNDCMSKLLAGEEVSMPTYNFKTGRREFRGNMLKLGADDILVIEGIHGLNEKLSYRLPKENKFKIYISALTQLNIDEHNVLSTTDNRLLRRMIRDARTRATTAQETIARWPSVRRGEEKNIFPFQEEADVMFNSALIYELPVLKCYAEPLLFAIDPSAPEYLTARKLLKFLDYVLPISSEQINNNSIVREFIGGGCFHV